MVCDTFSLTRVIWTMSVQPRYAQLLMTRKKTKNSPPMAGPAHKKAGPVPSLSYERWAVGRLSIGTRCQVEPSMSCIPLREDPICRSCYEGHVERELEAPEMPNIPNMPNMEDRK